MGNDVAITFEELPSARTIKVHAGMCSELLNLVVKVLKVFPEIEAARPRCSSGIEALCLLNNGIAKAKSLVQYCSESSVLYLALTGDAILSRCKKSRNILEQSLSLIQNMVPVLLASKISGIIVDLNSASFYLDPLEEEAGKVLRELLHIYGSTMDSTEETAKKAIQIASSHLHITSQKSLLIEKRSIKKLLEKFGETEQSKKKILLLFLHLLRKYGKFTKEQNENNITERIDVSPYHSIGEVELHKNYNRSEEAEININMLSRLVPPEEFICPLSSRLMHDPVVIASGRTYERAWIQKWFDDENDTCPKTKMKLAHLFFTSNMNMKDLILKWCAMNSVYSPERKIKETVLNSRDASMNSIASLSGSMNDLNLAVLDFSNVSFESTQSSMNSIDVKSSFEINLEFLSKFSSLSWESQCNAVEGVKRLLEQNDDSWSSVHSEKMVQLIIGFLKDAYELHDVEAMMTCFQLLLNFVQKHSMTYMDRDAHVLLASFLESQVQELLEPSLIILTNLSLNNDFCSLVLPSDLIPKLIPLIQENNTLARHCLTILKNLCDNPDARMAIAETEGSISSLVKILESEIHEEQELAVCILLSLCSQCVNYCQLVMDEGVIPGLVNISVNGNKKAKAMALEMLRILKDEFSSSTTEEEGCSNSDVMGKEEDDRRFRKVGGLFGRIFSKQSASSNKKR